MDRGLQFAACWIAEPNTKDTRVSAILEEYGDIADNQGLQEFQITEFAIEHQWFIIGESASFVNGAIDVAFVLFVPYGIVVTWRLRSFQSKERWRKLMQSSHR